jgi:hypothetical protein
MHTHVLAAGGLIGFGQSIFMYVVVLGSLAALGTGIGLGLKYSWKMGIGAGIGVFFGGVLFSILIYNAVGFRDMGVQELREQTGYNPSIYAG